jgi:hypothetical protein
MSTALRCEQRTPNLPAGPRGRARTNLSTPFRIPRLDKGSSGATRPFQERGNGYDYCYYH